MRKKGKNLFAHNIGFTGASGLFSVIGCGTSADGRKRCVGHGYGYISTKLAGWCGLCKRERQVIRRGLLNHHSLHHSHTATRLQETNITHTHTQIMNTVQGLLYVDQRSCDCSIWIRGQVRVHDLYQNTDDSQGKVCAKACIWYWSLLKWPLTESHVHIWNGHGSTLPPPTAPYSSILATSSSYTHVT